MHWFIRRIRNVKWKLLWRNPLRKSVEMSFSRPSFLNGITIMSFRISVHLFKDRHSNNIWIRLFPARSYCMNADNCQNCQNDNEHSRSKVYATCNLNSPYIPPKSQRCVGVQLHIHNSSIWLVTPHWITFTLSCKIMSAISYSPSDLTRWCVLIPTTIWWVYLNFLPRRLLLRSHIEL